VLTCSFGIPWSQHPGCPWCAAEGARLAALFAEAVARGESDAEGYTPAERRAQQKRGKR